VALQGVRQTTVLQWRCKALDTAEEPLLLLPSAVQYEGSNGCAE
jgi:hypothetical protein